MYTLINFLLSFIGCEYWSDEDIAALQSARYNLFLRAQAELKIAQEIGHWEGIAIWQIKRDIAQEDYLAIGTMSHIQYIGKDN